MEKMQETIERWSPRTVLAGTFILSAFPLLIVEMFSGHLKFVMSPAPYLVFHNIAEFFSIMVSLSMFGLSWFTYDQSKDRHEAVTGTKISIIATACSTRKMLAVVAQKDQHISSPGDLGGKKIGVTLGTNGQFFLDSFLLFNRIPKKDIRLADVPSLRSHHRESC